MQLRGSSALCENDTAEFLCSSTAFSTYWIIRNTRVNTETFSFGTFFTSPVEISGPGSSRISGSVLFMNSSILISRVIIMGAIYNGSSISCNGEYLAYYLRENSKYDITSIICHQINIRLNYDNYIVNYVILT